MSTRSLMLPLILVLLAGCKADGDAPSPAPPSAPAGTPVEVARVERATMQEVVSAPGRTDALIAQKVRAPFAGTLTALDVVEGAQVRRGQQLGEVMARDSEAALAGAEAMVRQAGSEVARRDAERALELARHNLVASPLVATVSGMVTARSVAAGDKVGENEDLLTIVAAGSLVFRASLPQSELLRVRPGQPVSIELAGSASPLPGRTAGLMPASNLGGGGVGAGDGGSGPGDLTVPLRIDFVGPVARLTTGLFGTAHVTVAEHRDARVVPPASLLRDDVAGTMRIGIVGNGNSLHWVEVRIGLQDAARVEIVSPPLADGTRVVLSGQVGLPEGSPLSIEP